MKVVKVVKVVRFQVDVPSEVERENRSKDEFVSPMNLNEVDVPSEAAKDINATNNDMYVRMRNDPRLWFKSRVIQTPFAVYSRKKKMIPK